MAKRSTRQKIKDRCDRLISHQEESQSQLYEMNVASEGRIPALEAATPGLLEMIQIIIDTCRQLRDEL